VAFGADDALLGGVAQAAQHAHALLELVAQDHGLRGLHVALHCSCHALDRLAVQQRA